ncbi:uncharacterized protein BDR25DRAFT_352630 [Lindgomyces ingoldianus]|uniref:Uncharacterized protein n=1 Tax=Lindgomyces ingoldianus TaxID=673940 RepID=A0ACB6R1Q3_9PLEO|nr:uncharacterized protein BDR25DRAFT_352630 [Lindgomyces ingoldianus]KAF2473184.1 hypothetical protein BDR25DRAFT_352630 [Lindgomyces ingoldianus]
MVEAKLMRKISDFYSLLLEHHRPELKVRKWLAWQCAGLDMVREMNTGLLFLHAARTLKREKDGWIGNIGKHKPHHASRSLGAAVVRLALISKCPILRMDMAGRGHDAGFSLSRTVSSTRSLTKVEQKEDYNCYLRYMTEKGFKPSQIIIESDY